MINPTYLSIYPSSETFCSALGKAFDALVKAYAELDAFAIWKSLQKRILHGIYMGDGLLLPHIRVQNLASPIFSFSVCAPGFTKISLPVGECAQFMCILLSPKESATAHTQVIANIAKILLNPEWKLKALKANSIKELSSLFNKF